MNLPTFDLTQLPVASQLDWRIEFGLWLRNTPSQKRKKRAVLTLDAYERDVQLMAEWFEGKYGVAFEVTQLNEQNVSDYFAQFQKQPATHKRKLASLRLLVRWAREAEVIDYDPTIWISTIETVRKAPRDLNAEERNQLETVAEAGEGSLIGLRDSLIFFLMSDGGLRVSEAINLLICDVDLVRAEIGVMGKGAKWRVIPIGKRLVQKIRLWLERMPVSIEGTLVTTESGLAICRQTADERFSILCNAAGVVGKTPHSCRHTFIKRAIKAFLDMNPNNFGGAFEHVSMLTGDAVEVILKYYTLPSDSEIRAAVEAM